MDKKNIQKLKKALEEERDLLVKELEMIATRNPEIEDDWKAIFNKVDDSNAMDDQAQSVTSWENERALEQSLETRLKDVKKALEMIEIGKYGICKNCGTEISQARLEAVPVTLHCMDCMNKETTGSV